MVDTIGEEDVARVDQAVDPTDLAESAIKENLGKNPNLTGDAVNEFSKRVAEKRQPVLEDANSLLQDRISPNPANPSTIQVRKADGTLGPKVPESGRVDVDLSDGGDVSVTLEGETVHLGEVNLSQGASGSRRDRSGEGRHPSQKAGGGR